ncbi:MAG TPA: hypothetical protein PKE26_02100 [Kiritimatiellia bacterium]|nr:hypothetical protein [Kiritimatiellia bacterium]HMO97881.1 hypothetical protein [Kiritimatiellia bacterium]HMP95599.1 hypothetical protein [Kiritimatiellia bacterium]
MKRYVVNFLLGGLLLAGCCTKSPAPRPVFNSGPVIVIDPTRLWVDTGVDLVSNRVYHLVATTALDQNGRPYTDKGINAEADGVHGMLGGLFNWMARDPFWTSHPNKRLRVLTDRDGREPRFLTLMGVIGDRPAEHELDGFAFTIGSSLTLTSPATGRLHVFVNDWLDKPDGKGGSNRYGNNRGIIILQVRQIE